ncbi:MAG: DUF4430 domain-containing protein [Methanomassiliicoccales archaeon]|nr:MAG: DUF4430 domain-containing protein [Methanomassiliicoccales archaeon]
MKLSSKDVVLVALAAVIISVIVLFGFPANGDNEGEVTTDITIDFIDGAPSLNPGNLTTWTFIDGEWNVTSVDNGGHTVWVFKGISSGPNCYLQLMAAAEVGGFIVGEESQPLGTLITSIAGVENEIPGAGWQYYVNGVYANRACNFVDIKDGDEVVWKFQKNQMD